MLSDSRPDRKATGESHQPPAWVSQNATFFITIACQQRGSAQLTAGKISDDLFSTVSFYHQQAKWFPEIFLLMPDHLHALISFTWDPGAGMTNLIKNWKRYTATHFGIHWQRGFNDHRIRSEADHAEKWAYIRDNPVKAGLVEKYHQWPHLWFPDRIGW